MKKLKVIVLFFVGFLSIFFITKTIFADAVIDDGLNFLKSKQDSTGRINSGFSAPSQWSAIAFAANGQDIFTIKNPSVSLKDFLLSNIPSEPSAATDWETRILAIVATGGDPTNYGGINYVDKLESFYNNGQIGDECSLNDDIFGLLAEVSAGSSSSAQIKTDTLNFLTAKQDPTEGGFGYSAPGCAWYSTSADMTGAAIQALVVAKNNGITNPDLDSTIDRAKNYLLVNQNLDGGYGYYGSSDTDTSGWVLMAFNVLDMHDSTPSANLKNWLISQQSQSDGGFLAFDYGLNQFVSNSTTTAQAVIGLSGKSWILKIFDPSILPITGSGNPTPTLTPTLTMTSTPTLTPTSTPIPTLTPQPTSTPVSTATPILTPTPLLPTQSGFAEQALAQTKNPTPTKVGKDQILGTNMKKTKLTEQQQKNNLPPSSILFFSMGFFFILIDFVKAHI